LTTSALVSGFETNRPMFMFIDGINGIPIPSDAHPEICRITAAV
jgi:hypothetical protein